MPLVAPSSSPSQPDDRRTADRAESLGQVYDALRLSAHVVHEDPIQLAGQLTGRLASSDDPAVKGLTRQAGRWRGSAWLRPLFATLTTPGGPLLRTLEGRTAEVGAVAVTPDGRRAISGSADGTLALWDLERGERLRTLEGHAGGLYLRLERDLWYPTFMAAL
ncbi:MAG: hypothetical protein PVJ64_12760, partial [Gemmatimonadales bacterium]